MNFLLNQLDRVRRRWYVVVAVMVVFVIGAWVSTSGQSTTYSAKAALSASSPTGENSPYALSLAYIYLFNDPSFQDALLREGQVKPGVSAVAEPATVGTIFYVETTAASAADARSAATALAKVFRDEINGSLADARQQTVNAVQQPFIDRFSRRLEVPAEERIALQDQINTINANTNGTVNSVGLDSAVTENVPSSTTLVGIALVAGLFAGVLAALACEFASRRIRTGYDVSDKARIAPVAAIADSEVGGGAARRADLQHLANRLTSGPAGSRQVIALVPAQVGARSAVHELGRALVTTLGTADSPALLVCTDSASSSMWTGEVPTGFVDAIADPTISLEDIAVVRAEGVSVIDAGNRVLDPGAAVTRPRVATFLDAARKSAEVVVLEAPVLELSPEGQVICAQADSTVLVVDPHTARVAEVTASRRLLEEVHATIGLAVVMAPAPIASHRIDHGVDDQESTADIVAESESESAPELELEDEDGGTSDGQGSDENVTDPQVLDVETGSDHSEPGEQDDGKSSMPPDAHVSLIKQS